MSGKPTTQISESHFFTLFADAVCFAWQSHQPELRDEIRRSFVRASILNAALAIESAANGCLAAMRCSEATEDDFERLKTLGKFDLFILTNPKAKALDREHRLVKPMVNLVSLRNDLVHPKTTVREFFSDSQHPKPNYKKYEPLGMFKGRFPFKPEEAKRVVLCVSDFLNYYFFDRHGFDDGNLKHRTKVANILSSKVRSLNQPIPDDDDRHFEQYPNLVLTAMDAWNLDFAFLGQMLQTYPGVVVRPKRKWGE